MPLSRIWPGLAVVLALAWAAAASAVQDPPWSFQLVGDEIGVLVCFDSGKGQPRGDGRTGMLSFFEPHAFLRLRLP